MDTTSSSTPYAPTISMPEMEGWQISPGIVLLGQRVEIGTHSDKYEVRQHSGGIVPFLSARVFDLVPDPIRVRRYRRRCIRRLEPRKVLEDTRGDLHVVVFVKDLAAPDSQIPEDVQAWLDSYASHVYARQEELCSRQNHPDTPLVDNTFSRLASEVANEQGLGRETHPASMDGALLISKQLLWQMIGGITSLVRPVAFIGIAYLVIFGIAIVGWLLLSLW